MTLMTLTEMSEVISETEGLDQSKVYMQLKGAFSKGLINASDRLGTRGAWRFQFSEFCMARLLIAAIDLGVFRELLAEVSRKVRLHSDPIFSFENKIANCETGTYILEITISQARGELGVWAKLSSLSEVVNLKADEELVVLGSQIIAHLNIRASAILRPYFARLAA